MKVVALVMSCLTIFNCAHALVPVKEYPAKAVYVGDFDDEGILQAASEFMKHVEAKDKTVVFNINSHGGSIFGGLNLIKVIEDFKKSEGIHTVCIVDSYAYSMGFVFLQSSACDERLITTRSTLLAHEGSMEASGTAEEIHNQEVFLRQVSLALSTMCADRMKMPLASFLARVNSKDWIFGAEEALKVGAVDAIVQENTIPPREY